MQLVDVWDSLNKLPRLEIVKWSISILVGRVELYALGVEEGANHMVNSVVIDTRPFLLGNVVINYAGDYPLRKIICISLCLVFVLFEFFPESDQLKVWVINSFFHLSSGIVYLDSSSRLIRGISKQVGLCRLIRKINRLHRLCNLPLSLQRGSLFSFLLFFFLFSSLFRCFLFLLKFEDSFGFDLLFSFLFFKFFLLLKSYSLLFCLFLFPSILFEFLARSSFQLNFSYFLQSLPLNLVELWSFLSK